MIVFMVSELVMHSSLEYALISKIVLQFFRTFIFYSTTLDQTSIGLISGVVLMPSHSNRVVVGSYTWYFCSVHTFAHLVSYIFHNIQII